MPTTDFVTGGAGFAGGGVGDGQRVSVTASVSSNVLTITAATPFVVGDIGKAILIVKSGYSQRTTISAFTSSSVVTLTSATNTASATTDILWGTDNTTAFTNFNTWAISQSGLVTLNLPNGRFCTQMDNTRRPFKNIPLVKLQGAGQTTAIISQLLSGQLYFGGTDPIKHNSLTDAGGNSARIYTANLGATTIQLKDITYVSKFAVNRYIKITGYDMQGINNSAFGYPPNPFYYEDNIITNISGDILTLSIPLRNTYKDTWPNWNSGLTTFEADPGGPATIYMPDTSYDTEIELNDFTADNPYFQSVAHGRKVVMNRVTNTGANGIYPTQNNYFEANDCDWSGVDLEIDKINGEIVFNNCSFRILRFQSSSADLCTVNGGTTTSVTGSPKRLILNNVAFTGTGSIQPGATSYGRTDEVQVNNCTGIASFLTGGATMNGLHGGGASATLPITGGLISFAKTENDGVGGQQNPTRVFVPGTWCFGDRKFLFQVQSVYEDGTNVYIQTNLPAGWPLTFTNVQVHPAPRFTMINCTGTSPFLEDFNQAPAAAPLFSYSKRSHVGGPTSATAETTRNTLWGRLVTAKFNVTTAYTGAGALTFKDDQFGQRPYVKISEHSRVDNFAATINVKTPGGGVGLRTIPANAANAGAQTGDILFNTTTPGQLWFYGSSDSFGIWSANVINGETPTVTVEYVLDQGIVTGVNTPTSTTSKPQVISYFPSSDWIFVR